MFDSLRGVRGFFSLLRATFLFDSHGVIETDEAIIETEAGDGGRVADI